MSYRNITLANIPSIKAGDRLIFNDCVLKVEYDEKYADGKKCGGMSVRHIIENYENVEWVRYA